MLGKLEFLLNVACKPLFPLMKTCYSSFSLLVGIMALSRTFLSSGVHISQKKIKTQ